jgi:hypothetical protein
MEKRAFRGGGVFFCGWIKKGRECIDVVHGKLIKSLMSEAYCERAENK